MHALFINKNLHNQNYKQHEAQETCVSERDNGSYRSEKQIITIRGKNITCLTII